MRRLVQWRYYPWVLWLLGASLFFSEYFVRTSSSVMARDLMHAFSIDAFGVSVLFLFFYWPYVLMQVPVGALVDRYGANRLLTIMAFVFTLGSYLFAHAHVLWVAEMARFLMGISAAFAFVGTLKLATLWFSSRHFGLLAGLTQGLGMVGASVGGGPVSHLVATYGWRDALSILSTVLLVISLLILLLMRDHPNERQTRYHDVAWFDDFRAKIVQVWANKQVRWIALFAGLLYAPTLSFAEFWGVRYLQQVQAMSYHHASHAVSIIFIGWAIGAPLMGCWSDRIQRRKPFFMLAMVMSLLLLSIILYVQDIPYALFCVLLFAYGFFNAGLVIVYALSSELNPKAITGLTMAVANMASVILGSCCNLMVGKILTLLWDGQMQQGSPVYAAHAYQTAFAMMPVLFVLGIFISYRVKETYCRRFEER